MTATRITQADIDAAIASEHYCTALQGCAFAAVGTDQADPPAELAHVTICTLILHNGMKLVGVNTGSIDPNAFSAEFARKDARQRAEDQVWPLLGYQLRERLHAERVVPPVSIEITADMTTIEGSIILPDIRTLPNTYTPPKQGGFTCLELLGAIAAAGLVVLLGLVACSQPHDDSDPPTGGHSGMDVYVDQRSGCQYLGTGLGGLTPRMGADGKQICGGAK